MDPKWTSVFNGYWVIVDLQLALDRLDQREKCVTDFWKGWWCAVAWLS
jgi:hypothetical protein